MEQVLYKLPDGWEWQKLADVVVKTENLNPLKHADQLWTYIDISSVDRDRFAVTDPKEILGKDAPSRAKKHVQLNDVIFATTRPNLKNIALVRDEYSSPVASTGFCILRANKKVLPAYLFYFVTTDFVQAQIEPYVGGASYPAITDGNLKKAPIPIPSIEEQKRIVEKLDALLTRIDTAIEHLQESVALADALYASTINEQMMQAIELAGLSTVEKHIEQIQTGTTPPTKQPEFYENGDINWFAPSDFGDHDILSDSNKKLSQKAFDAGKARKFDAGTIMLVAIGATIGKIGYLEQDASSNQQITGMKFNSDIIPRYAYYWFRFIKPEILTNASTATLPIINQKGIKALSFCAPNRQLQETICKKIDEVSSFRNTVKAELNEKVELMRSLKASILDSAFKGEL